MNKRRSVLCGRILSALLPVLFVAGWATAGVVGPFQLGGAGYEAVPADYDGDGKTDPAVYHESSGLWYAGLSSNGYQQAVIFLGGPGWLSAPADYDGDGKADIAVYQLSTYTWWGALSGSQYQQVQAQFGDAGYLPVPGDYDGDGKADLTLYHATQGAWFSQPSSDPGSVTVGTADAFRAALEQNGFAVQSGSLTNLDVLALFNAGLLPSCYGNNNDSPYLVITVPPAVEQTVSNSLPWVFRLKQDEAVIWVGKTPPEAVYYSIQPFLGLRYLPTLELRKRIYCNLGDTVNNFNLNTTGTPNGNTGSAFDQDAVIIFAADQGVESRVRSAAQAAGYSPSIMNTLVLPSAILNMGVGDQADEFQVLMRTAFFTDTNAAQAYISNPPVSVFRVTPTGQTTPDLFPMPVGQRQLLLPINDNYTYPWFSLSLGDE
ncbi:MAG: VCBS repeat-containing protein [Verrucomicrobia bacterium]|nr:VCBS repeat-containing protein [Verrucomicrobiota bacterium]MCG2681726.1 VCBS repeat-containing protein [Kiritimatiellia bacterium]MBU4247187.1 VCBS repeat-containing protein [Verrucomicrobiota bacterium]MBU4291406.1 VCBS repeat-containing protein [Verrucomicrobiota bacterium]MBU4428574.1 VCBS repeat-containing protein [Verrucomicrobiota bacterium]